MALDIALLVISFTQNSSLTLILRDASISLRVGSQGDVEILFCCFKIIHKGACHVACSHRMFSVSRAGASYFRLHVQPSVHKLGDLAGGMLS